MNDVKVTLKRPIRIDDKEVTELTFRPATVGDLIAGEAVGGNSQTGAIAGTLASMAGITIQAFKQISAVDFARINKLTVELVGNVEEAGAS